MDHWGIPGLSPSSKLLTQQGSRICYNQKGVYGELLHPDIAHPKVYNVDLNKLYKFFSFQDCFIFFSAFSVTLSSVILNIIKKSFQIIIKIRRVIEVQE